MDLKEEGIILTSMDYKDNHKIIYLLTKNGKKSLLVPLAKRIKSGLSNDTQNLNKVQFTVKGTGLEKATMLEATDYYFDIKNDLKKMAIASYALELIHRFVNSDFHSEILYNLLLVFLDQLKERDDYQMLLLEFKVKMLYFLGIQPNFKTCCHCNSSENLVGLSLIYGAMECADHETSDNIGLTATTILKRLYYDKTFTLTIDKEDVVSYLNEVLKKYYELHFKENLKSDKLLAKLIF